MIFQLTPSRRATINLPPLALRSLISTHALTEGDSIGYFFCAPSDISTHALTEGDQALDCLPPTLPFQLTPSRRATFAYNPRQQLWHISTHALTEGDPVRHILLSHCNDFNSRPHGGRLAPVAPCAPAMHFNSRPHGGRRLSIRTRCISDIFQLTPSRRATQPNLSFFRQPGYFNSRPHGGRQQI